MLLSLLLSRSAVRVVVLEQAQTFAREFRGELLQPGAIRIFDDIGLGTSLLSLSGGFPTGVTVQLEKKVVCFDFPGRLGPTAVGRVAVVPQQELLELLAAEAARRPEFSLFMGCAARELIVEGERVVGVRAGQHGAGEREFRAPVVVACDGRFSALRRLASIALNDKRVGFDLLWFSTPIPAGLANRIFVRIEKNELVGSFASRSNRMQIAWLIHKGEYARLRSRPFDEIVNHIADHVPFELRELVRSALTSWDSLALLPVVSQIAERWSKPGLLLIGDAAHPMSPVAGQGINIAIYDAVVAARRLVRSIETEAAVDAGLQAIEIERRRSVEKTQTQQNVLAKFLTSLGPALTARLALGSLRFGARTSWGSRLLRTPMRRFMWGEPEVRANEGPWH